jgi:hypothetical protein
LEGNDRPTPTSLESLRICLFCNKQCDGIKKCLDHMRLRHGFILLDVDCLVDLKGLLHYMAQRIQLGNLCLHCSKQFKDPVRCQQHMVDKNHCVMSMEDEEEYVDFYDFAKAFQDHPLVEQNSLANPIQEEPEEKEGDEWEECDMEDISSEEEKEATKQEGARAVEESSEFEEVDKPSTSKSFSVVDKPNTTQSFSKVDRPSAQEFCGESISSIKSKASTVRKGMTREEVFQSLNIKHAEYLPTGEIKLPNGKVLGHRKFHYIYKQRPKPEDDRESVLINKIALEYRKLRAI